MAIAVLVAALGGAIAGGAAMAQTDLQPIGCTSSGSALIKHGPRTQPVVALTFDDGPSRFTTPILNALTAAGIKATFFPTGAEIAGREAILQQLFASGMEVENHTFTHADLGNGGPTATEEMTQASDAIRNAIGFTPCIFRPPFASVGGDLVARARELGMSTVGRDVDPSDWETPGTKAIVTRVLKRTKNGSIINLHDGGGSRRQTVAAMPKIINKLRARGFSFATVSELLGYPLVFP